MHNPYAPPAAHDPALDPRSHEFNPLVPAERITRFFAAFIDGLLAMVIILPIQYLTGVFDHFPRVQFDGGQRILWGVAGFVTYALLHGWFLRNGQTVGKKLLRIQVVDASRGTTIPVLKLLLLRHLPMTIVSNIPVIGPFIGLIDALMIFGEERRCLHDRIAGTRVVACPIGS